MDEWSDDGSAVPSLEAVAPLLAVSIGEAPGDLRPVHAGVFGSVARGDARRGSDVDILLVRRGEIRYDHPRWTRWLLDLRLGLYARTDWENEVLDLSPVEMARMGRESPCLAQALLTDEVVVAGPPVIDLIRPVSVVA
ncbi:MAG: nucleotidyltransferase domain-containing protein [Acidimicrobiales bacterium]